MVVRLYLGGARPYHVSYEGQNTHFWLVCCCLSKSVSYEEHQKITLQKRALLHGPYNNGTMEDDGITGHDAQVVNVILRSSRSMRQKRRAIMFYLARAGRRVENHRRG